MFECAKAKAELNVAQGKLTKVSVRGVIVRVST